MLCVRWGSGLELEENMVVGESNVMPARPRGPNVDEHSGFRHSAQAHHHFQTYHCHHSVKSSCPSRVCAQSDIQLHHNNHYYYHGIPIAVRPAATSSVSCYHPPVDKQVPSHLHILHPVRLQVELFCSRAEGALPAQRCRRSCP
jgi:hypothetical protein